MAWGLLETFRGCQERPGIRGFRVCGCQGTWSAVGPWGSAAPAPWCSEQPTPAWGSRGKASGGSRIRHAVAPALGAPCVRRVAFRVNTRQDSTALGGKQHSGPGPKGHKGGTPVLGGQKGVKAGFRRQRRPLAKWSWPEGSGQTQPTGGGGGHPFWGRWGPGWAGGFLIPSVTGIPGRAREEGS